MARYRWVVFAIWVVVLAGCAIGYPQLGQHLQGADYNVNGSDSQRVAQLAGAHFAQLGSEQDAVVFNSADIGVDDPHFRSTVTSTIEDVRRTAGVAGVIGPFDRQSTGMVSTGGHTAFALVGLAGDARTNITTARAVQDVAGRHAGSRIDVAATGFSPVTNDLTDVENADAERGESIGVPVALVVLILTFGALVAAVLPLLAAGAGLLFGFGVLAALSFTVSFDGVLLAVVTMIGTAIGIDYSLFLVTRMREELARRGVRTRGEHGAIAESVGVAMQTAGRTITISGLIVTIAMCSLLVVDSPVFREITIGVAVMIVSVLAVALTLVPAVLAILGPRLNAGRWPRRRHRAHAMPTRPEDGLWARWARAVMRRPVAIGAAAAVALAVLVVPVGAISYGIDLGTASLGDTPSGRAQDVLADKFSPGMLSPIQIVATGRDDTPLTATDRDTVNRFGAALADDQRIDSVVSTDSDGRTMWTAVPTVAVDSTQAADLVADLRRSADTITGRATDGPEIRVGGASAQFADLSAETTTKLPVVIAIVLVLSLLFLAVAFRSVVLPVKAVLLNLLATGAALGVTVAVFQWGWGARVLEFHSVGYLQVYLPVTVFVVLFGVSMDYEVFLIGRMKEAWDATSPGLTPSERNTAAVVDGIAHTARSITAAAAIMVVVFAGFVSAGVLELKEFGVALAVAIALDAVVVRMILVPAFMRLLGGANWWPGTRRAPDPVQATPSPAEDGSPARKTSA